MQGTICCTDCSRVVHDNGRTAHSRQQAQKGTADAKAQTAQHLRARICGSEQDVAGQHGCPSWRLLGGTQRRSALPASGVALHTKAGKQGGCRHGSSTPQCFWAIQDAEGPRLHLASAQKIGTRKITTASSSRKGRMSGHPPSLAHWIQKSPDSPGLPVPGTGCYQNFTTCGDAECCAPADDCCLASSAVCLSFTADNSRYFRHSGMRTV